MVILCNIHIFKRTQVVDRWLTNLTDHEQTEQVHDHTEDNPEDDVVSTRFQPLGELVSESA